MDARSRRHRSALTRYPMGQPSGRAIRQRRRPAGRVDNSRAHDDPCVLSLGPKTRFPMQLYGDVLVAVQHDGAKRWRKQEDMVPPLRGAARA